MEPEERESNKAEMSNFRFHKEFSNMGEVQTALPVTPFI